MPKNKDRKFLYLKIALIGLAIILVFLSVSVARGYLKVYRVNQEIENLEEEISRLEGENQELTYLLEYLKSDEFVEKEARKKFGYKKAGENSVVVIDSDAESTELAVNREKPSNLSLWWRYFFGE